MKQKWHSGLNRQVVIAVASSTGCMSLGTRILNPNNSSCCCVVLASLIPVQLITGRASKGGYHRSFSSPEYLSSTRRGRLSQNISIFGLCANNEAGHVGPFHLPITLLYCARVIDWYLWAIRSEGCCRNRTYSLLASFHTVLTVSFSVPLAEAGGSGHGFGLIRVC